MDHGALIQLKEEVCFEVVLYNDHGALVGWRGWGWHSRGPRGGGPGGEAGEGGVGRGVGAHTCIDIIYITER